MPLTFVPFTDADKGPYEAIVEQGGLSGYFHGYVQTDDPLRALTASGLPVRGTPYGPPELGAQITRIAARLEGGTDPTGQGDGGLVIIRVEFGDPPTTGTFRFPSVGASWTDVRANVTTQQIWFGWNRASDDPPIANGDGAAKEVGEVTLVVTAFYPLTGAGLDIPRLEQLTWNNNVNDAPVTVPALYGTSLTRSYLTGQLRYRFFEIERNENTIEVRHHLIVGSATRKHNVSWVPVDKFGKALPNQEQTAEPYEPASFSGLWP